MAIAATEADLVGIGRHATAAHTERLARAYRRAEAYAALEAARLAELRREVTWRFDDDGSLVSRVRLPPDAAARLVAVLEAGWGRAAGASVAQCAADALIDLVDGVTGSVPAVVVHTDTDALARPDPDDAGRPGDPDDTDDAAGPGDPGDGGLDRLDPGPADDARVGDRSSDNGGPAGWGRAGGALPAASARRLTCDARVEVLVEDGAGRPLRLGRARRTVPPGLRRALEARDGGCRFPGCPAQRWLHAHHLRPWADGGPTDIDNLVLLCGHHHKLVHEFGWSLRCAPPDRLGRPAALVVTDPGGRRLGADPVVLAGTLADLDNPAIAPDAIRSLWAGEPFDLATAVEVLLWRKHRAGRPLTQAADNAA